MAARGRYQLLRLSRQDEARAEVERLDSTRAVLEAVNAAREAGDDGHVDRLLMAWKARSRRARDLAALQLAADEEFETRALSDEEIRAEVQALIDASKASGMG